MNITIYQINMERDENNIAFISHSSLERFQGSQNIDSKIYDRAYEADVECNTLEDVYRKFNLEHPKDYRGRSLSVSDIVEIKDGGKTEPGFYFCDNFGFKEVNFEPNLCAEFERETESDKITVLLIQPEKKPKLTQIETSLDAMQAVVGGDIEEYMPFDDEVAIICNEEGKVNSLPLNRAIRDEQTNEIIDIIAGDFFIAYAPIESENFKSLPKEMKNKYAERFKYPEQFSRVNEKIVVTPIKNNKDRER